MYLLTAHVLTAVTADGLCYTVLCGAYGWGEDDNLHDEMDVEMDCSCGFSIWHIAFNGDVYISQDSMAHGAHSKLNTKLVEVSTAKRNIGWCG